MPHELLQHIRQFCDQHGIMMIVDELHGGPGRGGGK